MMEHTRKSVLGIDRWTNYKLRDERITDKRSDITFEVLLSSGRESNV